MSRPKEGAPTSSEGADPIADDISASRPDARADRHRGPDEERPSASDDLAAAAELIRLDPHTAADLILDAEAHTRVPNDLFCYVCAVQAEQREGRRV